MRAGTRFSKFQLKGPKCSVLGDRNPDALRVSILDNGAKTEYKVGAKFIVKRMIWSGKKRKKKGRFSLFAPSFLPQSPGEAFRRGVHAVLIALACCFKTFKHGLFHPQRDLLRVLRLDELGVLPIKKATLPLVLLPAAPPGEHH